MKNNQKTYPINYSPLYKIGGKNRLAKVLKINQTDLSLLEKNELYRVFNSTKNGGKIREISEPIGP